ncbi:MAG: tRNA epoxyqueuosine(34) reductase QueG, partial [Mesorhizobium sp.]
EQRAHGIAERALLGDASPLVRGAAVWALSRLVPETEFAKCATAALEAEGDEAVQREWRLALADKIEAHA